MKILLLVKAIPDGQGGYSINYDDRNMLEMALEKKDSDRTITVDLLCFGDVGAKRILREGLSLGADRACLVVQSETLKKIVWIGPERTAHLLCCAMKRWQEGACYDVILCGYGSEDVGMGAVGSMVGEKLGMPVITHAVDFKTRNNLLDVYRSMNDGMEKYEVPMPALLCGIRVRRRVRGASFGDIQMSLRKELYLLQEAELGGTKGSELFAAAPMNPQRKKQIAEWGKGDDQIRAAILYNLALNYRSRE